MNIHPPRCFLLSCENDSLPAISENHAKREEERGSEWRRLSLPADLSERGGHRVRALSPSILQLTSGADTSWLHWTLFWNRGLTTPNVHCACSSFCYMKFQYLKILRSHCYTATFSLTSPWVLAGLWRESGRWKKKGSRERERERGEDRCGMPVMQRWGKNSSIYGKVSIMTSKGQPTGYQAMTYCAIIILGTNNAWKGSNALFSQAGCYTAGAIKP